MVEKDCPTPELLGEKIGSIIFLTCLFFLTFISRYIFAPLMPSIEQDLNLSHAQAGSIFLVAACGNFIGALGAGILSSRINHKDTLVCSTFFVGVVMWTFMFVSSLTAVRLGIFILAIAAGLNLPSSIATITAMVSRQDWGKALGIQQVAPPLSLVLGPIFVVVFLTWFNWRMPLAVLGSIAIAAALLFAKFGRSGEFPGDPPSPAMIRSLMGYKSFWIIVVLFALAMGGQVGVYAMLPAILGYMGQTYSFGLGIMMFGVLVFFGAGLVFALTLLEKMDPGC